MKHELMEVCSRLSLLEGPDAVLLPVVRQFMEVILQDNSFLSDAMLLRL